MRSFDTQSSARGVFMDSGRAPVPSELLCRGASRNVVGDRVVLVTVTVTGDQAVHDMADPLSGRPSL